VIPWRTEGVFRHRQRSGENDKVDGWLPAVSEGRRQHLKIDDRDGRSHRRRPARRSAIVRIMCTAHNCRCRCHHIDRRMRQPGQTAGRRPISRTIRSAYPCPLHSAATGGEEIAPLGETIGADRPALRQRESAAVNSPKDNRAPDRTESRPDFSARGITTIRRAPASIRPTGDETQNCPAGLRTSSRPSAL